MSPFLLRSPPTSATHNTPCVGATAENATRILSAAVAVFWTTHKSKTTMVTINERFSDDVGLRFNIMTVRKVPARVFTTVEITRQGDNAKEHTTQHRSIDCLNLRST